MSESPAGLCESGNVKLGDELFGHGYRCAYPEPCHIPVVCKAGMYMAEGGAGEEKLWE